MKNLIQITFALFIATAIGTAQASAESETNWLGELSAYHQVKVLKQKVKDLNSYSNRSGGAMLYEPTGEVFSGYDQIKNAIPTTEKEFEQAQRQYYQILRNS